MSNGKYGSNQWKIRLFSVLVVLVILLAVGGVAGGTYVYIIKPKYDEYQVAKEEESKRLEEERLREEEQLQQVGGATVATQPVEDAEAEEAEPEPNPKALVSQYEVVVSDATWTDAKRAAEDRGGHLVVITSAEEQQTVENLIDQYSNLHTVWIGGAKMDSSFNWINGEAFSYSQWGSGEPNNETGDEVYMDMYELDDVWYWNDVPNDIKQYYSGKMGFVIEWEVEQ